MSEEDLNLMMKTASACVLRHDYRKAREQLRIILSMSPDFKPALRLMGRVYFQRGDYRNAIVYWARADYWKTPMEHACQHVLKAAGRALRREKTDAVRYQLLPFAGSSPPPDIGETLTKIQSAYFKLDEKQARQVGLACTPLAGICMLIMLGLISGLLGAGWSIFAWLEWLAVAATAIVLTISICRYLRASNAFRRHMADLACGISIENAERYQ